MGPTLFSICKKYLIGNRPKPDSDIVIRIAALPRLIFSKHFFSRGRLSNMAGASTLFQRFLCMRGGRAPAPLHAAAISQMQYVTTKSLLERLTDGGNGASI
jgi:hypothetical protein